MNQQTDRALNELLQRAKHGATGNKQHSEEAIQMRDSYILKCKAILESLESTKCFMRVPQVIYYYYFFFIITDSVGGRFWVNSRFQLWIFVTVKWLQNVAIIKLGFSVPQMILWYAPPLPLNHSWSKTQVRFFVPFCFSMHPIATSSDTIRRQRWVAFTALGIKAVAPQQYCQTLMWLTARSTTSFLTSTTDGNKNNWKAELKPAAITRPPETNEIRYQIKPNYGTVTTSLVHETGKPQNSQIFPIATIKLNFDKFLFKFILRPIEQ